MTDPWKLPLGWNWAAFGDVARVAARLVDPALHQELPHVAPNHIESGTGRLLPHGTVADDGVTSAKHRFFQGQLLYSKIRPYLAKVVFADFEGLCSADMYPIETSLEPKYLKWWMLTDEFTRLAAGEQARTVLPKINKASLVRLPVPVPKLAEQRRIVEILEGHLSRLDAAAGDIESARNKLAVLLPAGVAAAFRASGGTTRPFGEVAQWGSGGTPKAGVADYYVGGTIPWLNSGDLADGPISTVPRHITDLGLAKSSAKWVPPGSVLVAMYGATIGRLGLATTPLTTNQAIAYATLGPDVIAEYLFWFLRSQRPQLIAAGKGGAQPNISQAVLKAWELPVPDLSTQEVVVRQAEFIAAGVNRLSDQLQRLRRRDWSFRKALFAAAFSGRLTRITSFDEIEEMADV